MVAAVLSLGAADGRLASASFVAVAPIVRVEAPAPADPATTASPAVSIERPRLRAELVGLADGQSGSPFSYAVQVRNDAAAAESVRVSTVLPPEFSNVRVNAPGFACTRQFSASGPQAGTEVSCMRNALPSGAAASVTVEANAPGAAGEYRLVASVDTRDDAADDGEDPSEIAATVHVDD